MLALAGCLVLQVARPLLKRALALEQQKIDKLASGVLAPARVAGRGIDQVFGVFGKQFTLQAENARLSELGFSPDDINRIVEEGMAKENIAMILKNNISRADYFDRIEEGNIDGLDMPEPDEVLRNRRGYSRRPQIPWFATRIS